MPPRVGPKTAVINPQNLWSIARCGDCNAIVVHSSLDGHDEIQRCGFPPSHIFAGLSSHTFLYEAFAVMAPSKLSLAVWDLFCGMNSFLLESR